MERPGMVAAPLGFLNLVDISSAPLYNTVMSKNQRRKGESTMKTDPNRLERNRRYREAHREELRERGRIYHAANAEKRRESARLSKERNKEANRDRDRDYARNWKAERRQELIAAMGGKCVRCGYSDWRALQVDHINGGGNIERKSRTIWSFYKTLSTAPDLEKYQLLCANCNQIKRYERNENRQRKE